MNKPKQLDLKNKSVQILFEKNWCCKLFESSKVLQNGNNFYILFAQKKGFEIAWRKNILDRDGFAFFQNC